ncbi:lipopolysaccharide biosynthesis protein [Mucilaginibacter sp. X4EP1]|uniref:lipopolysaccharide biosynthesis protein n=1 Tax=Mucilaginibacter sp. X4EP1 TaxID=2723092 RepID=UPI002169410D|nr:hypothetical protein [Mucilaginibacter sp. X4EP1]MCS3815433.1 O-antigen/teichoic acid export membrane protein [Mucilaginibacter sp. X4EP1]
MSATKRLLSGSLASWIRIGVTMVTQMALVPLYLSNWSIKVYAIWLAIQALVGVLATVDIGHQQFIGFEFFRFGDRDREGLSKLLCSAIFIGVLLGLAQIMLIVIFLFSGVLPGLLGSKNFADNSLIYDAGIVLLLQGVAWLITGSVGGLLNRALSPFGYAPRMAWWGVFAAIVVSAVPAFAVAFGANLLMAGFVLALSTIAYNIPLFIDMFKILKREKIKYYKPSVKEGFINFGKSLAISARGLLESARQQGSRLILNPLAGPTGLVAYTTMRTGANVALQGLGTITNPLLPELMRFLHKGDQERSETAFATVWIIVIALLAPGVVVLQVVIEPIFVVWTRGKIHYDPLLFGIFSQSVLVFAVAQPAMAIMEGNNLLKPQLTLSALSAVIVVGGMYVLVPVLGIRGAGISLLVAEIVATLGYRNVAKTWLKENGLKWPQLSSSTAVNSIWLSALSIGLMIIFPKLKLIILPVSIIALYWNCLRYWNILPVVAQERARDVFRGIFKVFKIIKK